MNFYWVNINKSYKEVIDKNFLWAPAYKKNSKGQKIINAGWKYVPLVKCGDIIFCNYNSEIKMIALAEKDAYPFNRPVNKVYDEWQRDGYKIEINSHKLAEPLNFNQFKKEFNDTYNSRCKPKVFTRKVGNNLNQTYMCLLPAGAGNLLLKAIGDETVNIHERHSQVTSNSKPNKTIRQAIINARVGQGVFRNEVLELWKNTCPITNISIEKLLIASHILPWSTSDDNEKLDKYNGLPLSPCADRLFDQGFISFTDNGQMLISDNITEDELLRLGINPTTIIERIHKKNKPYLVRHREEIFLGKMNETNH